jgi:hypothetical protein
MYYDGVTIRETTDMPLSGFGRVVPHKHVAGYCCVLVAAAYVAAAALLVAYLLGDLLW